MAPIPPTQTRSRENPEIAPAGGGALGFAHPAPRAQGDNLMRRRTLIGGAALMAAAPGLAGRAEAAGAPMVERFAATLNAHDIDAFAALFSEAYVNHQTSAAAAPPANLKPKDASVGFFAARLKAMPNLRVSIQASLAEGDKEAASFLYEGAQTGPYFGVPPTGRLLTFSSCDIFRIAGGLIVEHWGMGDIAGVLAQLKG